MSRRVAFLACETTLPGSARRRVDAFEHDNEVDALRGPLAARAIELVEVDWADGAVDWASFDLAVVRTTWNYLDHVRDFVATLHAIEGVGTPVCNPPSMIEWNIDKAYLRDLEQRGAPILETEWIDQPDADRLAAARRTFADRPVVVKPRIGAGAIGQRLFGPSDDLVWPAQTDVMVQPFVRSILDEGEWSFVFVDGEFSHALLKTAAPNDYRIQSMYGGREEAATPAAADLAAAQRCLDAAPEGSLYARVDMVRTDGDLVLMELELAEPYLYPKEGPGLGELVADAIERRIG